MHRPFPETTRDGVKTGGSASSSSRDDAGRTALGAGFVIALSDCQVSSPESEIGTSHLPLRETMLGGVRKSHRPVKEMTRDGVKTRGSASFSSRDDAGRVRQVSSPRGDDTSRSKVVHRPLRETMLDV